MSGGDCGGRQLALVERAFVGDLGRRGRRRLRSHLVACPTCRGHYDRLALIDGQLGAVAPVSRAGIDAVEDAVLDAIAPPPWHRRPAPWIALGMAAAAAALLVLILRPSTGQFRERGGPTSGRTPGVRLFCVRGDGEDARVVAEGRVASVAHPAMVIRCNIGDALQLAYTTPPREGLTMVAFARRDDSILHYAPRPGETSSFPLVADQVDEPLPWSTRLAVRHQLGAYELVVRFYDRPVVLGAESIAPTAELRGRLEITP